MHPGLPQYINTADICDTVAIAAKNFEAIVEGLAALRAERKCPLAALVVEVEQMQSIVVGESLHFRYAVVAQ